MPKFVPRERKHKVRHRNVRGERKSGEGLMIQDSNTVEIFPGSITEKEQRKQILRAELSSQKPQISSQKQKRLNKYIVRYLIW